MSNSNDEILNLAKSKKYDDFKKAVEIFEIPQDQRSENDKQSLRKLMSRVLYFENALSGSMQHEEFLEKCCSVMQLEKFQNYEPIFHFNDIGNKFYVILQGNVDIYVPKSPEELKEEFQKTTVDSHQMKLRPKPRLSSSKTMILPEFSLYDFKNGAAHAEKNELDQSCVYDSHIEPPSDDTILPIEFREKLRNKLYRARASIGLALSCQIKCNNNKYTDDHPVDIFSKFPNRKQYFDRGVFRCRKIRQLGPGDTFGELALTANKLRTGTAIAIGDVAIISLAKGDYKAIFEARIERTNTKYKYFREIFPGCSTESVNKFAFNFKEKVFKYGQKLYSQGEDPVEFFAISKGEVQLMMKLTNDIKKKKCEGDDTKTDFKSPFCADKLVNLGPGVFVGEEEVLANKKRMATAISISSETMVYSLSIEEFKMLKNCHNDLIQMIIEKMESKNLYLKDRLANLQRMKTSMEFPNTKSPDYTNPRFNYGEIMNNENPQHLRDYTKSRKTTRLPNEIGSPKNSHAQIAIHGYNSQPSISKDIINQLTKELSGKKAEFEQKFHLRFIQRVKSSDRYITSKDSIEYEQTKNKDPTEIIESKLKIIKSKDKFHLPVQVESPLFAKGWSNIKILPRSNTLLRRNSPSTNQSNGTIDDIHNNLIDNDVFNSSKKNNLKKARTTTIISKFRMDSGLGNSRSMTFAHHQFDDSLKLKEKSPSHKLCQSQDQEFELNLEQTYFPSGSNTSPKNARCSYNHIHFTIFEDDTMSNLNSMPSTTKPLSGYNSPASHKAKSRFNNILPVSPKSLLQISNTDENDLQTDNKEKNYTLYGRSLTNKKELKNDRMSHSNIKVSYENGSSIAYDISNNDAKNESNKKYYTCQSRTDICDSSNRFYAIKTDPSDNISYKNNHIITKYNNINYTINSDALSNNEFSSPFCTKSPKTNLKLNLFYKPELDKPIKRMHQIDMNKNVIDSNINPILENKNRINSTQRLGAKTVVASKHNMFRMNPTKEFLKKLLYRDIIKYKEFNKH